MSEPYPAIKNTSTLLEVVDSRNTPLCLMPATTVARQELPHRAVAVLLRDNAGRFLLKQTSGQGWDFSSHAALPAGQANEDLARALLWQDWQQ
ncbi:MAG: NUDIX hydrolase, partial [Desulfovibrionaceae bacterium]|nr:NUDIX hydrolase [Desulfovibrionaceae bacterium]